MPNQASLTHTHASAILTSAATCYVRSCKLVLDFWAGILLAMAKVLAIVLVLIMSYVF
jgi:hypothetical protein